MPKKSPSTDKPPEQFALERIQRAIRKNSSELDLSSLGITSLPAAIGRLTSLVTLNLAQNELPALPAEIGNLTNLNSLNLSGNKLNNLPSEIGNLTNLISLNISDNQLSFLPNEIGKLQSLEELDLNSSTWEKSEAEKKRGNKLQFLPPEFGQLSNLKTLRLSANSFKEFPRVLLNLTRLESLDLDGNDLVKLPSSISKLEKLVSIRLFANELTALPEEIGGLKNLREMHVMANRLTSLPVGLRNLDLSYFEAWGNPLPIPPEILQKSNEPQTILHYYFTVVEQRRKAINEIKLLIVGQGSVGKTSLVEQILHGTFDQNQKKTEGISINQWAIGDGQQIVSSTIDGPSSIKVNIWDFGGQEIMHATHQFFLTKRSLYLLVLDARLTQEENRVEYWLKIIQSFGGESPVLIVGNKTDQHPLDIDRTGLQKKYPNIVGIMETSAATGAGIKVLKAEIAKQVDSLPHVRDLLPETWFAIKTKLEDLSRDKSFITQDEYLDLCKLNEITDEISQQTLLGFLHDLGVILHFQDDPRLGALGILNPQWVTNGVYRILNSHELFQNQGKLNLALLNTILNLPEYPKDKHLFIVDMMKKFELCYDLEPDKSFLIPDLLPKDEPFTGEWDGALAFQYHYNVLPSSIISRFIVRMNPFIHKTIWRSGAVLKSGGNTALVRADTEERKIYILVTGNENTRREFLSLIRTEFDAIHQTLAKIEVTEKVPLVSTLEVTPIDLTFLQRLADDGREFLPVQVGDEIIDVNIHKLLESIRLSKGRVTKVFISYSHMDKSFVKRLVSELAKDNIESWWDFDRLKGGQDWQKEIERAIKRCDFSSLPLHQMLLHLNGLGMKLPMQYSPRKQ